jgi:hypothetical protein
MLGGSHWVTRFSHGKLSALILGENQVKNWFQGFHPCENQLVKPQLEFFLKRN